MLLHLVRHAESLANIGKSTAIDCDLSDLGRAQTVALAAELRRLGVDHVLSSPYRRTLETARAVVAATGASFEVAPALHEHHTAAFPTDWPLMTRAELSVNFEGLLLPEAMAQGDFVRAPESDAQVLERLNQIVAEIEKRFAASSQRLVIVTHGSPAWRFLQAFLGATDPIRAEVTIANASITTLEVTGTKRIVRFVNRVDHLAHVVAPPPLIESAAPAYL